MQGRRGRRGASLKPNNNNEGCMFYHPGESQLVLSKQQLRNQRRGTPPACTPAGTARCLGQENMCSLSCWTLKFVVEPVTLRTEDKLNAPSL